MKRKTPGDSASEGEKRKRLEKRNEKDRARRRAETAEEKEVRLTRRRERDRTRRTESTTEKKAAVLEKKIALQQQHLAAETLNERAARLERMGALQQQHLAVETLDERAARLERMGALKQQRLAVETLDERAARLEHKSVLQKQRLATETIEDRAVRLNHLQQNRDARGDACHQEAHLLLLEQKHVKDKMAKFHQELFSIGSPTCSVCMEKFPGMKVNTKSECQRCARDKHTPKLFSRANDMHPGATPAELQVSNNFFSIKFYTIVCMN